MLFRGGGGNVVGVCSCGCKWREGSEVGGGVVGGGTYGRMKSMWNVRGKMDGLQ